MKRVCIFILLLAALSCNKERSVIDSSALVPGGAREGVKMNGEQDFSNEN